MRREHNVFIPYLWITTLEYACHIWSSDLLDFAPESDFAVESKFYGLKISARSLRAQLVQILSGKFYHSPRSPISHPGTDFQVWNNVLVTAGDIKPPGTV